MSDDSNHHLLYFIEHVSYGATHKELMTIPIPLSVVDNQKADDWLTANMSRLMAENDWSLVLTFKVIAIGALEAVQEKEKQKWVQDLILSPKKRKGAGLIQLSPERKSKYSQLKVIINNYFNDYSNELLVDFIGAFSYMRRPRFDVTRKNIEAFLSEQGLTDVYLAVIEEQRNPPKYFSAIDPSAHSLLRQVMEVMFEYSFDRLNDIIC